LFRKAVAAFSAERTSQRAFAGITSYDQAENGIKIESIPILLNYFRRTLISSM